MILWEPISERVMLNWSFTRFHLFINISNMNVAKLMMIPKNRAMKMPMISGIVMEWVECFFSFFNKVHLSSGHSRLFHFCNKPTCAIKVILKTKRYLCVILWFKSFTKSESNTKRHLKGEGMSKRLHADLSSVWLLPS